ncbi:MAG: sialidase family protein, partial [Acidimicrobiales bacterium]
MWRWFRIGLAVAAGLLLLLAVWAPDEKRGPGMPGRSVVVNDSVADRPIVRSVEAPNLLVDRRNSRLVYVSAVELTSGDCKFYVSIDGGTSWRAENAPQLEPYSRNCALGSAQPQNVRTELAQSSDGTLFYVFQGNDPDAGGTRSVLLGRSIDSGRTWETAAVEAGPRATDPAQVELNYMAHVAVDPRDPKLVYVMWRRSYPVVEQGVRPKPTRPYFAVSQDGGASFGPATQLVDSDLGGDGPRPVVVGDTVYA